MQPLYHELGILSKAVAFKNLSAAADHVKLSQSQLSRIIGRLEDELQVVLLDRSVKKGSGWTPVARKLADIFERNNRRLENELASTSKSDMVAELHIGTLEGLSDIAMKTTRACFEDVGVGQITLDLYDLAELESRFVSGSLDFIFTSRIPARHKFKYVEEIGSQKLEEIKSDDKFGVYSTYEYNRASRRELDSFKHVLVSNSLAIKKEWFDKVGGTGRIPGQPTTGRATEETSLVYMIGTDVLSPALWKQVVQAIKEG